MKKNIREGEVEMEIRVTEPPRYPGVVSTRCVKCDAEILVLKSAKRGDATVVLDERPGPYKIEGPQDDGTYKAAWRREGDYAFHFDGGCSVDAPTERTPTDFERIKAEVEAPHATEGDALVF